LYIHELGFKIAMVDIFEKKLAAQLDRGSRILGYNRTGIGRGMAALCTQITSNQVGAVSEK
jgi:hypothetical protein